MHVNEKIFREYDIRGIADTDLTHEVVANLSRAIGTYFCRKGAKNITLGRDCRVSSPWISELLANGLRQAGLNVIDIALVPTPLLYFSVFELEADGGIMVTGSHNPPEHNGFKIVCGQTTLHGEDIQEIKQMLLKGDFTDGSTGTLTHCHDIKARYIAMVSKNIKHHPKGLKVVVDSGNGMGGMVAADLFRELGCEVTDLFPEPDGTFPNHHPDPTVIENLRFCIEAVKKEGAVAGVGFDGDADRIGVVDQTGRVLFGDELLVLYSRQILKENPGATIISEVKASHRLFQDIARHGGVPIQWKTGHSLIKAKMKEEKALLAGEMSGHIFFNDRYYGFDDALYAAARLFEILALTGKTPVELLGDLPASHTTPEIRVDCPDESKFQVVQKARESFQQKGLKVNSIDGARVEFADGWGLVRASNTQPVLVFRFEASTEPRLREIRKLIEGEVNRIMGH